MSSSSSSTILPIPWTSDDTAVQLINSYEKSLPLFLAPTIPYHLTSASSSSTPSIPLDVLPTDIMYTCYDQTVDLGVDLSHLSNRYNDIDPIHGDYLSGVHINILINICNRLGLEVQDGVLQSYKDAIWDFIEDFQSYQGSDGLFIKYINDFLLKFKPLNSNTIIRQDLIKLFKIFLKQDTVMEYLSKLPDKLFCSIYRVFQLFGNENHFSIKLSTRPSSDKISTARVKLSEYLLNSTNNIITSNDDITSNRTATTNTTSGAGGFGGNSGGTGRVRIQTFIDGSDNNNNSSSNNNINNNSTNSATSTSDSDRNTILQLQQQIAAIMSVVGKGQITQSNNNDFSSLFDSVQATTPHRSPANGRNTSTNRNRTSSSATAATSSVPVATTVASSSASGSGSGAGAGFGNRNSNGGSGVANGSNRNNSLFTQLQYMSSGAGNGTASTSKHHGDSDSDDDGDYSDHRDANNGGGGFGSNNYNGNGGSGSGSGGFGYNGGDINGTGGFNTNVYMYGCLVSEESFASILQKEIDSYASHEQYFKQELSHKIHSKQIKHEINRLVMLCDALHGIGIGNNVPSIYTKHHIYEIIARIIVGLQIADENGTYDILEGLIGQQKFALPVSIISQLNKARLQGKKLESKRVIDAPPTSYSNSYNKGNQYNKNNNNNNNNNSSNGGFSYNSHRGGRGGSTHHGGGGPRHGGGYRGGFNGNGGNGNGGNGHQPNFNNNNTNNNHNNNINGGAGGAGITVKK